MGKILSIALKLDFNQRLWACYGINLFLMLFKRDGLSRSSQIGVLSDFRAETASRISDFSLKRSSFLGSKTKTRNNEDGRKK